MAGDDKSFELLLLNRASEIVRVQDRLETFAREHGFPARKLHEVQLALEEHLTNLIRYAYDDQGEHQIKVRCNLAARQLQIEIEDNGGPFNPLDHPTPDVSLPIAEKPVGGLGIHMMRKSLDGLEYRTSAGTNVLRMIKQF